MTIQIYTLGFLFTPDFKEVVLIRKNKPLWQKGLFNGVGGKVEADESPADAMVREFKEETGVQIDYWEYIGNMQGKDWIVYCYKSSSLKALDVKTTTDEVIKIIPVNSIKNYSTISNLQWLIPLCLDEDNFMINILY